MICTCIESRKAFKNHKIPRDKLILVFQSAETDLDILLFFNADCNKETKSKYHRVHQNSKFAKFYRKTFANEPDMLDSFQLSKANQMLRKFKGLRFDIAETTLHRSRQYLLAASLPVLIAEDSQSRKGKKSLTAGAKKCQSVAIKSTPDLAENLQKIDNENWHNFSSQLAENWHNFSSTKSPEAAETLGLQPFSSELIPCKDEPYKVTTIPPTPQPFIRRQGADETDAEFLDRFLAESLSNQKNRVVSCGSCKHFSIFGKFSYGGAGHCAAGVPPVGDSFNRRHTLSDCAKYIAAEVVLELIHLSQEKPDSNNVVQLYPKVS